MNKSFAYTFKLSNSITRINLPFAINNVTKLKVKFVSYTTASSNQKIMMFKISQFNSNVYYNGVDIVKYSKILARGKDKDKDQSYFLCRVKPEIFEKTLFYEFFFPQQNNKKKLNNIKYRKKKLMPSTVKNEKKEKKVKVA